MISKKHIIETIDELVYQFNTEKAYCHFKYKGITGDISSGDEFLFCDLMSREIDFSCKLHRYDCLRSDLILDDCYILELSNIGMNMWILEKILYNTTRKEIVEFVKE